MTRRPGAVVTGANGDVGRSVVLSLARAGYRVAAVDLAGERRELREQVDTEGFEGRVGYFDLDVRDASAASEVVEAIARWSDERIEVLVHCARVTATGLFMDTPVEAQRAMFDVNYLGVARVTRAALAHLQATGRGQVFVVSSIGALAGLPGLSGFCASSAAVEGWAESVDMEVLPYGVGFTMIEPAGAPSGAGQRGRSHVDPQAVADAVLRCVKLGPRWAPVRLPVGATALARHAARGVVPPAAQRALQRRVLGLAAPSPSPALGPGARVLVTGASSGLGQGLVRELHDNGWRVFATVRDAAKASALQADLGDRDIPIVAMDQTDEASVVAAFAEVSARTGGRLDAVVANAGLKISGPFAHLDDDALRNMLDVNVFGTWSVARHAIPMMQANGHGRIIVVGSSSGLTGIPGWSGYASTKFALEAWAESVAYELEPDGIRVTVIEPGTFKSEIFRDGSSTVVTEGPFTQLAAAIQKMETDALEVADGPEAVIDRVLQVLRSPRPRLRAPVGDHARVRHAVRGIVPGSILRRLLAIR